MGFLARIEQACAAFIERTFAKTFPSDLEPAQIARKLVATMEARTRSEEGGMVAPGGYVVFVNPDDHERLSEHQDYLEREWAELLRDLAARVGVRFREEASVTMTPSPSVPAGAVDVAAVDEATVDIRLVPEEPKRLPRRFHLRMMKGVPAYGVYYVEGKSLIGRSEECDVFLVDPSVSRTHAIVELVEGEPSVLDMGSTNGTFVNGKRIEASALRAGDELKFGNTVMRFEASGE